MANDLKASSWWRLVRFAACGVLAVLAACGTSRYPMAPAAAASPDYRYLIGPLDTMMLSVSSGPIR